MKGRLTFQQINSTIEQVNSAFNSKYKLLATPRSKQSIKVKDKIVAYREQENADTAGN